MRLTKQKQYVNLKDLHQKLNHKPNISSFFICTNMQVPSSPVAASRDIVHLQKEPVVDRKMGKYYSPYTEMSIIRWRGKANRCLSRGGRGGRLRTWHLGKKCRQFFFFFFWLVQGVICWRKSVHKKESSAVTFHKQERSQLYSTTKGYFGS